MTIELPAFAGRKLKEFLASGHSGSITFNSDGQAIRQVEVKLICRDKDEEEKGR